VQAARARSSGPVSMRNCVTAACAAARPTGSPLEVADQHAPGQLLADDRVAKIVGGASGGEPARLPQRGPDPTAPAG
jgi:hypothetical protein